MRVAVVMFGIPRGAQATLPRIRRLWLEPLRHVSDLKVVCHLFRQVRVENPTTGEHGRISNADLHAFSDFDCAAEDPDPSALLEELEQMRTFGDFAEDNLISLRNLLHQLHSLQAATLLAERFGPDAVVFLRPDLLYHAPAPISAILGVGPRTCILPPWHWWGGYNDRLSICGSDAYRSYGSRGRLKLDYCRSLGPLHPEKLLRFALRAGGVRLRTLDVHASRVRVNGVVKQEDFDPHATLGGGMRLRMEWNLARLRSKGIAGHQPSRGGDAASGYSAGLASGWD